MDRDRLPTRPVIASLTSANAHLDDWLRLNNVRSLIDADGVQWHLKTQVMQRRDPDSIAGILWEYRLQITTEIDAGQLIDTGTLCKSADERLITMIGDRRISMALRPVVFHTLHEDEAKIWLADAIMELKAKLLSRSLHPVKRQLIGRYIDERCRFASGFHRL